MPTKLTDEIIIAAIGGFEAQKRKIDDQIAELRLMLDGGRSELPAVTRQASVKRKRFSAAARKKMALAQKTRWARIKGESNASTPVTAEATKVKRKISPEGMRRIIAATKKRWRLQKSKAAEGSVPAKKAVVKKIAPVKKAAAKKPSTASSAA